MCCGLVLFVSLPVATYGCWGGGELQQLNNETDYDYRQDILINEPVYLGAGPDSSDWAGIGWGKPPGASANWGYGGKNPVEPGPGQPGYKPPPPMDPNAKKILPDSWKGLGAGFGGAGPPEWAYAPKNYGKPRYCFYPPVRGPCNQKLTRYGFNPFADKCMYFTYSGCGANENNFISFQRCQDECGKLPGPDCGDIDDPANAIPEIEEIIG